VRKEALKRKAVRWGTLCWDPTCLKVVSKQQKENNISQSSKYEFNIFTSAKIKWFATLISLKPILIFINML
jgi:hypothetical protein